jgi:hypothetical protein
VVLPEAEADRDGQHREADDDPRAEFVEVLDECQALVEVRRSQARHGC